MLLRLLSTIWLLLPGTQADHQVPLGLQKVSISTDDLPPPPDPEPVAVTRLPLPPIAPSDDAGSCSLEINPHGTGCFGKVSKLQSGSFLPDNNHIVAVGNFAGAPSPPNPASMYAGQQLIIIKTNGQTFQNGDSWKCVTCGISEDNHHGWDAAMAYPQAFRDGRRILAGANIIECAEDLTSEECTPENIRIYPLRWDMDGNDTGPGAQMRELRLHPDNVHLGFSQFHITKHGTFNQYSYFGRLKWNPNSTGGESPSPRYDVVNVSILSNDKEKTKVIHEDTGPPRIVLPTDSPTVGELRGFSGSGQELTYIGYPTESSNIDVYAANLQSGKVRRLTAHPEYCDPVDISPDDKWHVVMDTRGTERQMFLSGLRGIPPLTDLVNVAAVSSVRNNGYRRFFQPWLLDHSGDRDGYVGQKLNAEGSGVPGSGDINDPEWNGMADPKWSWDGTRIVYTQVQTMSPACGGANPLPCYPSKEDGGRSERIMVAHLAGREASTPPVVEPVPDEIPWGTKFPPGSHPPERPSLPPGEYRLQGKTSGHAAMSLASREGTEIIETVSVVYHDFSDDGLDFLIGSEKVSVTSPSPTLQQVTWYSNITQTGPNAGTKMTSPGGFNFEVDVMKNIFQAKGSMVTTVGGEDYFQPANGT